MPTYVALLRSVNVGGRKLAMDDLRDVCAGLGHTDVRTYIQSGNVVFRAPGRAPAVRAALEGALARETGLDVAVLLRSPSELRGVLAANPYGSGAYVTFLADRPAPALVSGIDAGAYAPDELTVVGREVFLRCPNGYGRTKLDNAFFERRLRTRATTRNWNTVTKLAEWAGA